MAVTYSCVEVPRQEGKGESAIHYTQRRLKVACPYNFKDAVKGTGFAVWYKNKSKGLKFWHIPATTLSLLTCCARVHRAYGVKQHFADAFTVALSKGKQTIKDVKVGDLPFSVMKPWDHQLVGSHAIGQLSGVMLAYGMGCGKSKSVLDAIVHYGLKKTLVVCPSAVVDVWGREARKHLPEDFQRMVLELDGRWSIAARRDMLKAALDEVAYTGFSLIAAINYEALASPHGKCLREFLAERKWDLIAVDESHRIANQSTKISKFLAKRMAHMADHRVCLSGTPLGQGLQDVFGQFLFLDPAVYGEYVTVFRSRYCVMGGFEGKQVLDYTNKDIFKEEMSKLAIRVRIEDVVDLPERQDIEVPIRLNAATLRMYKELRDEFIADHAEGVVLGDNVLKRLLRLQQITSGFTVVHNEETEEDRLVELDTAKTDSLTELLTDMGPTEPVVVFARFVHDLWEIKRAAVQLERPSFMLGGGNHEKNAWCEACDSGKGAVIAVQIQAGGEGINEFVRARYCVYFSMGFSLVNYRQSRRRIWRPGQNRAVVYYHLVAPGTVDRMVYRALAKRKEVVDSVVEELTTAQELISG